MREVDLKKQIIVLFDEQGTPTFGPDRETDWFLGVAITYDLSLEKDIFNTCNKIFGLSNEKPLKNNRISTSRVEQISNLVIDLPIQIVIRSVNLGNEEFKQVLTVYEQLGNELRKKYRQIEGRNIAQILYSQILVDTVFTSVTVYMESHKTSSAISINLDHHCFPKDDMEIHLKDWAKAIQNDIDSFYKKLGPKINVHTAPILLMEQDSPRKRFVDVVTSAVSRYFLHESSKKYSHVPLKILLKNDVNSYKDTTQETIDFIRCFMDDVSRNPPYS
jgi:hypothetical protein